MAHPIGKRRRGWADGYSLGTEGGIHPETQTERPGTSPWASGELVICADGKARLIEPKYAKMVDGISGRMGPAGPGYAEAQEEDIDGSPKRTGPNETLPQMRKATDAEEVQRQAGGQDSLFASGVLRSDMHGGMDGGAKQEPQSQERPASGGQESGKYLRTMRPQAIRHAHVRSPQRPEPAEQQQEELADFVRLMPSSLAFAKLHGDAATQEALLAMLEASGTQGLLQYASYEGEKAWRSLDGVARQRLWDGLGQAGLVRTIEPPLAQGIANRVGRLRAYGNSIVVPQAAVFIRAYMEVVGVV